MYYAYAFVLIFLSILLIFFVLIQRSKGGGIAANFAGNNQALSDRRATETVEKYTWGLLIAILLISIIANLHLSSRDHVTPDGDSPSAIMKEEERADDVDLDLGTQDPATKILQNDSI